MIKNYLKVTILVLFNLLNTKKTNGQSITPFTLNNGGGFSTYLEWSINESTSIANFSNSNFFLNTGILQPLTNIVTNITEYGPSVFGNQITLGPNPTINILHLSTNIGQTGNLSIELLDSKSSQLYKFESGVIINNYEKDIQMNGYSDGLFYVRVVFKTNNGNVKKGVYKIIKLSK